MRILVTGAEGQIGWELCRTLQTLGEVRRLTRADCDLADPDGLRRTIRGVAPDLLFNAAAYTSVDRAETEQELASRINARAPGVMAEEMLRVKGAVIHFSTDYVFDGMKTAAYLEEDAPQPISVYGRTKRAGELAIEETGVTHLILRTSWVYAARGANFMRTMLRLAADREELRVVDDQRGAPTWARTIAEAAACIVARAGRNRDQVMQCISPRSGVYHMTCADSTTWFGFAQQIFATAPDASWRLQRLVAISTDEYPTPARRPHNSVLDNAKIERVWGIRMPSWREALRLCLG